MTYDVGWYPAIVSGDGLIVGELYEVPVGDMPSIDSLEGEGHLYMKRCERVTCADGKTAFALAYVYLGDVSSLNRISSWGEDYVWYVAYGSNMQWEGFMRYILGGSVVNSRIRKPCKDRTPPLAVKAFDIHYDMYFGNESSSWGHYGVSFLDATKPGNALGVAYLITKEQFEHVVYEENGRKPKRGGRWYEDVIDLDPMQGIEAKTVTNLDLREPKGPRQDYRGILFEGIKENYPQMSVRRLRIILTVASGDNFSSNFF